MSDSRDLATLRPDVIRRLSVDLKVDAPSIVAICIVEAPRGPFLDDGFPACLFERHLFHRLTGGRFDDEHPALSNPRPGGYGRYSEQPLRVASAALLDLEAAYRATSWGAFQILGDHAERLGYQRTSERSPAEEMAENCRTIEGQAETLRRFLLASPRTLAALREHRWADFARSYNGPGFRSHPAGPYDERLEAAFVAAGGS